MSENVDLKKWKSLTDFNQDFERMFGVNYAYVYYFILGKVKDIELAKDLTQDTFIKAYFSLKKNGYKERGKFLSWALKIAFNRTMDHFRNLKRSPKRFESIDSFLRMEELLASKSVFLGEIEENDIDEEWLIKLMYSLPPKQREAMRKRYFEGKSFKVIAEETGVSINTALGRIRYGKKNLKKIFDDHKYKPKKRPRS